MWACGVVLHILLVGYAPFTGRTERETLDRSVRGEYAMDPLDWARISQDARDLVRTAKIEIGGKMEETGRQEKREGEENVFQTHAFDDA